MLTVPLLAGCAAALPASNCAGWTPIAYELHDADVISDTLAVSIAQHNRHFAELCAR